MLLVIDNYDSFTYNLVQYLGEMDVEMEIHRNDRQITLEAIDAKQPEKDSDFARPCSPAKRVFPTRSSKPTPESDLCWVCLGHQCIGHSFGAEVVVNYRLMHGKISPVLHDGKDLFKGVPSPVNATRYHSLVIKRESMPDCLEVTAQTEEGEIMGIRHKDLPVWGVQFHPESILSEHGRKMLKNFLELE